ncbi:chaperone protein HtpG-like [Penaeus monodon]|uniref:chaperone protein HtpG-like n=1 Tax=Penaeus monodon TaxID=6687 RepID=UPI0018A7533B|nr:chaperone protein HtpG-like [Penaeus monodon]
MPFDREIHIECRTIQATPGSGDPFALFNPDIFLREIVSNASDAIDRARFEAVTNATVAEPDGGWKIKITPDEDANTLTISDTGIGMNAEEIAANIGTIANSGTRKFLEELQKGDAKESLELIGQFGVGFYSAFMAADKVTVITRRAGGDEAALKWESTGDGTYTLEPAERDTFGTDIILHLSEGKDKYLKEWTIREIIKKYSDYVAFPIVMDVSREEPIPLPRARNWRGRRAQNRNRGQRRGAQLHEGDLDPLQKRGHRRGIQRVLQSAVPRLPGSRGSHSLQSRGQHRIQRTAVPPGQTAFRHVQRALRARRPTLREARVHHGQVQGPAPALLRFVKGVVDSSDLPLNVSREILQEDALIRKIQKNLVKRILKTLAETKEKDLDKYLAFYEEFGRVIKEGAHSDHENREKIHDLLLFESSKNDAGKLISLKDYVDNMHPDQKEIYYISGTSREAVENSPLLEAFKSKGFDVLFMIDPIDEWVMQNLNKYSEKDIKAVHRGEVDLDSEDEKKEKEEARKEAKEKFSDLTELLQKKLDDDIKEVRISDRLTDSAVCLVADQYDMDPNMERIMKAMGQEVPKTKRILEINPGHPFIAAIQDLANKDAESNKLDDYAHLLFEQALIAEGSAPKDPARFSKLLSEMMLAHSGA